MKRIFQVYYKIKIYGFKITFKLIILNILFPDYLNFRRKILSIKLNLDFSSTVGYGPFKGVKILSNSYWSEQDIASILIGFYEKEVTDFLIKSNKNNRNNFIDIGAADGYFAISLLKKGFYDTSICFEQNEFGIKSIKKNLLLNQIDSSRVQIKRKALPSFYKEFSSDILTKSVILIDIEGGEFDLLTDEALAYLNKAIIIIELHPFFVINGKEKEKLLAEKASKYFEVNYINSSSRNPNEIYELRGLNDNDKWLICSEGRSAFTQWLTLTPKK